MAAGEAVDAESLADATIDPVAPDEALAAEAKYRGLVSHPFPGCFVCGPENAEAVCSSGPDRWAMGGRRAPGTRPRI